MFAGILEYVENQTTYMNETGVPGSGIHESRLSDQHFVIASKTAFSVGSKHIFFPKVHQKS